MLAVSPVVWGTDVGQAMGLAAMLRPSRGVGWLLAGHSLVQVVWVMAVCSCVCHLCLLPTVACTVLL